MRCKLGMQNLNPKTWVILGLYKGYMGIMENKIETTI